MSLAYLVGVMLGNGGVYGNYYTVFCRDPNLEFINFIASMVEELFGVKPDIRRASKNQYVVSTNAKKVHDFLLKTGFPKGRKPINAQIPELFRHDIDVVKGLFDSEGYCGMDIQTKREKQHHHPFVGIEMLAKKVVVQAHHILQLNGVESVYRRGKPYAWGKHYQWRLTVEGRDNVEKFSEKVGFRHPEKAEKLRRILVEGGILRDHTPRTLNG